MTNEEERTLVEAIEAKRERGEVLSNYEHTVLHFSPYAKSYGGHGGGCLAAVQNRSAIPTAALDKPNPN